MPYRISVRFGDSDTMRRGISAPAALSAKQSPRSRPRFISKLELRSAREGNSGRAEAVFKIGLVEQVIGLEVEAKRPEFIEGAAVAQHRLGARWTAEPERAAGDRSQVIGGASVTENSRQARREPLRGKGRVLMTRRLIS